MKQKYNLGLYDREGNQTKVLAAGFTLPASDTGVVTFDKLPTWLQSGDIVEARDGKTFAVSLSQTETRLQKYWRKLKSRLTV
jgi:hypothetical protein